MFAMAGPNRLTFLREHSGSDIGFLIPRATQGTSARIIIYIQARVESGISYELPGRRRALQLDIITV